MRKSYVTVSLILILSVVLSACDTPYEFIETSNTEYSSDTEISTEFSTMSELEETTISITSLENSLDATAISVNNTSEESVPEITNKATSTPKPTATSKPTGTKNTSTSGGSVSGGNSSSNNSSSGNSSSNNDSSIANPSKSTQPDTTDQVHQHNYNYKTYYDLKGYVYGECKCGAYTSDTSLFNTPTPTPAPTSTPAPTPKPAVAAKIQVTFSVSGSDDTEAENGGNNVTVRGITRIYIVQPKSGCAYHSGHPSDYVDPSKQVDWDDLFSEFYAKYPNGHAHGYSTTGKKIVGFVDD